MPELLAQAPSVLYAPCTDKKGRGRGIYLDAVKPLSMNLLENEAITDEFLQPIKVLANTDVFALLRNDIFEQNKEIDQLHGEISKLEDLKQTAIMKEDFAEVERIAFEQVAVSSVGLEKHRKKIDTIFAAASDVDTFQENYEAARDGIEQSLGKHSADAEHELSEVTADIEIATTAQQERCRELLEREEAYDQYLKESNGRIQGYTKQHQAIWDKITDLFAESVAVATKHQEEVQEQMNRAREESQAKALADRFLTGLESYVASLQECKACVESTQNWILQLQEFTAKQCDEIEAKNIVDEAVDLRVTAQLAYLEDYRKFKSQSDTLLESEHARLHSLGRLKRNLEFQIKEAMNTLDPNRKKYSAELAEIEEQIAVTKEKMDTLQQQIKKESAMWQPTEELLEDAGVDFTPPDIEADKQRVELKTKTIGTARAFINEEQELVDKDTMELRKFKTSSKIAIEDAAKRREEKFIEGPPAAPAPDSHATPPPAQA